MSNMSGTLLLIMCVAIVAGLAIWMVAVQLASRRQQRQPQGEDFERRRGQVQGTSHVGGGRSVAPHRDMPVVPGEDPEGSTLPDNASEPLPDHARRD